MNDRQSVLCPSVRIRRIVGILLAVCALASGLRASAQSEEQDRDRLLRAVDEIIAPGAIPGDFVVFGDRAFVVMTGRMGKARLPMIAAARYGQGRVVAAGHEGFFAGASLKQRDNQNLATNSVLWVGGKPLAGLRVGLHNQDNALRTTLTAAGCHVETVSTQDLPSCLQRLNVLWLDQASLDGAANRARVAAVRQWTREGGGLIVTGPAWGWQQTHPALDLMRDQSGNQLLLPMGIAFSTALLSGDNERGFVVKESATAAPSTWKIPGLSPSFFVKESATALTQARQALDALEAQAAGKRTLTKAELQQVTTTLGQAALLPESQSDTLRRVEALCAREGGAITPTPKTPITTAMPFARLKATLDAQRMRRLPADKIAANPAAESFPGPVPADAPRLTRTISIDTRVPDWHGTGLYAAPGELITVTTPPNAVNKGLAIRIGAHTDTLWHLDRWERFPEITLSRPLNAATVRIANPFGGALYVVAPEGCQLGAVSIAIANAVAAPRFVRGVTSLEAWRTIRNAPAPWAELEGRLVILTVPSSVVRDLDDPEALMAYWDEVMELCFGLFAAPKRSRPERYCVDQQISAGYMHSGYPIMTGEDVAKTFCDLTILRGPQGSRVWGFYHEMGHNFQRPEWTWEAFGEVTNNLFSLYGTEKLNGAMIGAHPAMTAAEMEKRVRIVASAPGRERYYARDPWYPLTMFWLMRREFGWKPFTQLFAEFRDLPADARPKTEAEKHDQFLVRFSKATGRNLADYLAAWGVEISATARAEVANLPAWKPPDWPQQPSGAK